MNKLQKFSVVNFAQYDIPQITEDRKTRYDFVPVGINAQDDFFESLLDAYTNSTTNAACIDSIADLIFGKGLESENTAEQDLLETILPPEELKRIAFEYKLFGNAAAQVIWNTEHTKVLKIFHIPVSNLRAEKVMMGKIEAYYYCTDWKDQRELKKKLRIPAYGCSTESREILWIKSYTPQQFYYSSPDWISGFQYALAEAEVSNLHLNNLSNGFLPLALLSFNNGVPAPEEREVIEGMVQNKFTGTRNAGRFMIAFNDDPANKPTVDTIDIANLHEKVQYVSEAAQDRILVSHRVTSPLIFGIRTANNGFSSNAEELKSAYSILQTMTIAPFQGTLINLLKPALQSAGVSGNLQFQQLTPLAILADTAEATGTTIDEAEDATNDAVATEVKTEIVRPSQPGFEKEYTTE
jgi:hypothetical protein